MFQTKKLATFSPFRPFYVFPCGHKFHSDCIIAEILPLATNNKRRQVEELQRRLEEVTLKESVGNLGGERSSMGSTGSGNSGSVPSTLGERLFRRVTESMVKSEFSVRRGRNVSISTTDDDSKIW